MKISHHPPHILLDDCWYLVDACTHQNQPFLQSNLDKQTFREHLFNLTNEFSIRVAAWVILDNHYHLLFHADKGNAVKKFIQQLHGRTAYQINKRAKFRGRQIWHNYWDTVIRGERDYWIRFNYIHHNPVKHGYARRAADWKFSSYGDYVKMKGQDWVDDVLRNHPIIDLYAP